MAWGLGVPRPPPLCTAWLGGVKSSLLPRLLRSSGWVFPSRSDPGESVDRGVDLHAFFWGLCSPHTWSFILLFLILQRMLFKQHCKNNQIAIILAWKQTTVNIWGTLFEFFISIFNGPYNLIDSSLNSISVLLK